jgi:hypothetical protein
VRPIDAPKRVLSTTREAADWIGLGRDLFEETAEREGWMRPVWCGHGARRVKKWHWMDLVCLAHILQRRHTENPPAGTG